MIDTFKLYEKLSSSINPQVAKMVVDALSDLNDGIQNAATKEDFRELKEIVHDLAEAQKRTEARVEELAEAQKRTEARVEELAEAQTKTEKRLDSLTIKVEELAEAQKRTEARVEELAEAQKRTEARVEELAEAQKRTEARVEELAQAQQRTERSLQKLIKDHAETRKQLGGLSMTVGYTLENESFKHLPTLLDKDYSLKIQGRLKRDYARDRDGNWLEVNIIGVGLKDGKEFQIIGESKAQLSKKGVDEFIRKKLKRLDGIYPNIFPILVTHMITAPDVKEYTKEKGIALYFSYDF